ncbi:GMC oxidoreductase [Skermania piniformis]|uniref:Cholesterol oxidase n=1 Tax=Skermania pinensis TaxID=39122 RepID=A0ABX8S5F9_9ACTN|nr:GMC oxidoreductase [Skermania piniformis]QXQ13090.1 GMC family oxidoreductase N-terminal domain-containing protein [Skermania piniformis]
MSTAMNRRRFLTAGAVAGAALVGVAATGAATAGPASAAPFVGARTDRVPLQREQQRVVIIGSGFGGGVAALRLAQAGVASVVLERGRRWPTGPNASTFPSMNAPDKRALWFRSDPQLFGRPVTVEPYVGLFEAAMGDNMTVMCAAGVGGGSLVYQGMSLEPAEHVFDTWFPSSIDWSTMHREYYPRVSRMLGLATAPDELIASPQYKASRVFADHCRRAGFTPEKIPMPIDWNYALAELRGEMKPSYTNGDCAIGVNNGGKHSVDVTYFAQAEATGLVDLRTLHEVASIARTPSGSWEVHVRRIDENGTVLGDLIIETRALILGAGSVNTTRLLVKAAATGAIPDLPGGLGTEWGTNADRIYVWTDPTEDYGVTQGGPVVYGTLNWSDPRMAHTIIQASMPSFSLNLHSTMMVGYGVSAARGSWHYDSGADRVGLQWPRAGDSVIQNGAIGPNTQRIAGPTGFLSDTNLALNSTWHPLGGANMGVVCDTEGRVFGQRGLYVVDGALMPGTTAACNPSMTIAAIAERALDVLIGSDVGTII